jgi:hypothetical protein
VTIEVTYTIGSGDVTVPFEVWLYGGGGCTMFFGGHDGFIAEDGEFLGLEGGSGG